MNGNPGNPMANGWVGFWWVGVPAFPYSPGIDVQLPVVPGRDGVRPPGQPDDAGSLLGVLLWLCMQLSVYVGITVCLGVCVCECCTGTCVHFLPNCIFLAWHNFFPVISKGFS